MGIDLKFIEHKKNRFCMLEKTEIIPRFEKIDDENR